MVREILIYNNNKLNGSFLYFKGNFDPVKIRNMAKSDQFEKLGSTILQQFGTGTPGINNSSSQTQGRPE